MIEVEGLSKHFGVTKALDNLSFRVDTGEILGFLGPNGAGKTTMMRILTGYLTPSSGVARVGGCDVQKNSLEARRKIGYLPESAPVYRDIRVKTYLKYLSALKAIPKSEQTQMIDSVMDKCGLHDVQSRIIGNLSKGYRQRVGLAQALLGDPEILIMDEPTEGLDPKQIIDIRNLIRDLGGSRTIILSTHILPEVSMICERVIILNKGKLIAVDTPDNLIKRLQQQTIVKVGVVGPVDQIQSVIKDISGVKSVETKDDSSSEGENIFLVELEDNPLIRSAIAEKIVTNRWGLTEMHAQTMSLEDIFVQLVTQEQEMER